MRESLKQRKGRLAKSKDTMQKKEAETNIKYQRYAELKGKIRTVYIYHYNEMLRLLEIDSTNPLQGCFEFRDDETPKQLEEFVLIPSEEEKSEKFACINLEFEACALECDKRYELYHHDSKRKTVRPDTGIEEEFMSIYRGSELNKVNSDDYQTKILTFYDDEALSRLHLKEALVGENPLGFAVLSQRITDISFFLLSVSCISNIPLLYNIHIKQDGYCIEGNKRIYRLSLYLPAKGGKKGTALLFEKDKKLFERGVCLLNKDLIHLAYVLGCPVPTYQDTSVLPINWFYKYKDQIIGEPLPVDKIDNSDSPKIFKNIDVFLLKAAKREIQKFVVEDYFCADHFPTVND
eukprot:TRINITY_DN4515_c0_g1_i5.p1 TRINITY_DN4515_c0_g1~~TRINITY_DN4515_c0_g1_i5.p1  ORF type:complete len:349 (-),score=91.78 TRINITY_DN4515_c0_g1_i5:1223-2269(-)